MREIQTVCWMEPPHASKQGDHVYRTAQPCSALARVGGLKVVSGSSAGESIVEFAEVADLLVLCDSTDHRWPALIERRRVKGLRTVYEINDQFLALQAWNSTAAFFQNSEHRALTLEIASLCDGLQFTNEELANRFGMLQPNHRAFWNQLATCPQVIPGKGDSHVIGWAGSWGHLKDLEWMLPVLEEVGRLYPTIRFAFMGDPRFETLWRHWDQDRVSFTPGSDLASYLSFLSTLTIGIAPLRDTEFNRCRSDVKFLEYASQGVVSVLADLPPYEVPIHREAVALGFDSTSSLRNALVELLSEPAKVSAYRERAFTYVKTRRLEDVNAERRLHWYRELGLDEPGDSLTIFESLWQGLEQGAHPMDRFANDGYRRLELGQRDRQVLDALLLAQSGRIEELKSLNLGHIPRVRLILAMVGVENDWASVVGESQDPLAYRRAFQHFLQLGQLNEASRYLETGLKSFPKNTTLKLGRVELYRRQGAHEAAMAECRTILDDSPFAYPARDILAHILSEQGLRDEAIELLRITKSEPDPSLNGQLLLAHLLAEKDEVTEALEVLEGYPGYQHLSGTGEVEWLQALAKYALANNDLEKARTFMKRLKATLASTAT